MIFDQVLFKRKYWSGRVPEVSTKLTIDNQDETYWWPNLSRLGSISKSDIKKS